MIMLEAIGGLIVVHARSPCDFKVEVSISKHRGSTIGSGVANMSIGTTKAVEVDITSLLTRDFEDDEERGQIYGLAEPLLGAKHKVFDLRLEPVVYATSALVSSEQGKGKY